MSARMVGHKQGQCFLCSLSFPSSFVPFCIFIFAPHMIVANRSRNRSRRYRAGLPWELPGLAKGEYLGVETYSS